MDLHNMPRKSALALFIMETGHACCLHRMGCLQSAECIICKQNVILNKSNFTNYKSLNRDNLAALYLEA